MSNGTSKVFQSLTEESEKDFLKRSVLASMCRDMIIFTGTEIVSSY